MAACAEVLSTLPAIRALLRQASARKRLAERNGVVFIMIILSHSVDLVVPRSVKEDAASWFNEKVADSVFCNVLV